MAIYALYGVAVLLALAPIAVVLAASPRASNVIYGACLVVALVLCVVGVISLLGRTSSSVTLPSVCRGSAHISARPLAAFFIIVVNLGGVAASLFALGYGQHEQAPERVLPFYPAYLAGMNLVVLSDDAFSFLVSWEFMSLSSWALVVAQHWERENLRAGYIYLLMASFGTLALFLGFGLLAGANGNYAFDAIRASHPSAALAALVLILALIGAGSKAGIVPLHAWLPLAHPAAPSHVSALMSGVMTKVAVYGFIRIAFDLLGAPEWWWSMLVLAAGGITL
jgi:formate hydrogenlyase subunit 3/multisubunit Na+/H+ antiporter MnhD subunit